MISCSQCLAQTCSGIPPQPLVCDQEYPESQHVRVEHHPILNRRYCWWKKSCTTWDVKNHPNDGILTISTGAGFLPSTVRIFIPGWNFLSLSFVGCIRDDHLLKAGHLSANHSRWQLHFAPRQPLQCNHRLQFVGCAVLAQTAEWRQTDAVLDQSYVYIYVYIIYDLCTAMIYRYSQSCSGLYPPNQIKEN